jgi:dTDP-4-dehydrorhamnose 3,5-epimerase
MIFTETPIGGVITLEVKRIEDERGFFGRIWCQKEFDEHHIDSRTMQINTAFSRRKGTVRGIHYQEPPFAETKVIRCTRGTLFDVAVDLRPSSPTFKKWFGIELSAENQRMLVIPPGCAHGYQTMEDATEQMYMTSEFYMPTAAKGVRFDDPEFAIRWPLPVTLISSADAQWPLL